MCIVVYIRVCPSNFLIYVNDMSSKNEGVCCQYTNGILQLLIVIFVSRSYHDNNYTAISS